MKQTLKIPKVLNALLLLCFLPCSAYGNTSTDTLKDVSVQLDWKNQFQHAGFYIAKEKGYYKDIGLDVTIKEWQHGINVINDIITCKSEYGISRSSVLIDISKGKDLVLLSAIYQSNPLIILTDKRLNIKSVSEFKNKRIMITEDHIFDSSLLAMFNSQGIKISDMNIIKHSFNPMSLLNGETDIISAYISNEPFVLKEIKGEPVIFNPKEYGFDFYNDILIVNRQYLEKNMEEVKKFNLATLKGFEYAFNHIYETVSLIYNKYNTLKKTKEALFYEAKELKKLAYYKTKKIGTLKIEKLERIYDIYKLLGLAKMGLDIQNIIYSELLKETKLTPDEKKYLSKKQIKVCICPEWHSPFYDIGKEGNPIGICIDYLNLLEKKFNIDFIIVQPPSWKSALDSIIEGECDILPFAIYSDEKTKFINFTNPYLKFPIVLTTRKDINFVNNLKDLKDNPVSLMKDHHLRDIFKEEFRNLNIKNVKNIEEGFNQVNNGEIIAFIDSLPSIAYSLQRSQYNKNLKISGRLTKDLDIRIGVRAQDKKLFHIIQKCLNNITSEEKQKIKEKWLPIEYETDFDYILVIKITGIVLIILVILIYWNKKITHLNKELKKSKLKIEQKNKKLNEIASTDNLTKLYNKSKIDEILQKEIDSVLLTDETFGICLLDIDSFKQINDTYGHQFGDKALISTAKLLSENIRTSDYIGRWGGEEFLIIFPKVKENQLEMLAEKVRKKVKETPFEKSINITVSIGTTMFKKDDTIKSIIRRADNALYKAKRNGKDCVIKL